MTFRKSTRCESSSCVEVELPQWRKSSASLESNCVEVAYASACGASGSCVEVGPCCGDILVRDSKNPDRKPLCFDADEWRAFLAGVRAGEFDLVLMTE